MYRSSQRKQMYKRLNAIDFYKDMRKEGLSHKDAVARVKDADLPFAHIRKSEHTPFKSER
jgi:hypothetical protein